MNDYIITRVNGIKEELSDSETLISANDEEKMKVILNSLKVKRLKKNGGQVYGTRIKRVTNKETKDTELWRDEKLLLGECGWIIPIFRKFLINSFEEYGVIFFEKTYHKGRGFLNYRIKKSEDKKTETFDYAISEYCTYDRRSDTYKGVKSIEPKNKNKVVTDAKKQKVADYVINSSIKRFSYNSLFAELTDSGILEEKDKALLVDVINKLQKAGTLSYEVTPDRELLFSVKENNKKNTR